MAQGRDRTRGWQQMKADWSTCCPVRNEMLLIQLKVVKLECFQDWMQLWSVFTPSSLEAHVTWLCCVCCWNWVAPKIHLTLFAYKWVWADLSKSRHTESTGLKTEERGLWCSLSEFLLRGHDFPRNSLSSNAGVAHFPKNLSRLWQSTTLWLWSGQETLAQVKVISYKIKVKETCQNYCHILTFNTICVHRTFIPNTKEQNLFSVIHSYFSKLDHILLTQGKNQ